jgi:hypothetical protein
MGMKMQNEVSRFIAEKMKLTHVRTEGAGKRQNRSSLSSVVQMLSAGMISDSGLYPSEYTRDVFIKYFQKRGYNVFVKYPDFSGDNFFGLACFAADNSLAGIYDLSWK